MYNINYSVIYYMYNWGHLDKVDQSDYRKITIHSENVSCQSQLISMNRNKQLGSKSAK